MHLLIDKTDEELMGALAGDGLDAAAELFRRHHKRLFNFFLRMGFDRANAGDLVQTVFERVIRYRHSYQGGALFRTWMYQIARNVQKDEQRKRSILRHQAADMVEAPETPAPATPDNPEQITQLENALRQLPEEHREVLLLTRYEGLKYAEAGEILGCSEGAVKVKVFRALQQLRIIFFKLEKQ